MSKPGRVNLWTFTEIICFTSLSLSQVPTGSPSRGGDVTVYVLDINQPSLPTLFLHCMLVSVSVFIALSTVFYSINSPDNPPLTALSTVFHFINSPDNSPLSHFILL